MKSQKKTSSKIKIKDLPAGKKAKNVKGGAVDAFLYFKSTPTPQKG